jgi:hypothetical protein
VIPHTLNYFKPIPKLLLVLAIVSQKITPQLTLKDNRYECVGGLFAFKDQFEEMLTRFIK